MDLDNLDAVRRRRAAAERMREWGFAPGALLILLLVLVPIAVVAAFVARQFLPGEYDAISFFCGFIVATTWKDINAYMLKRGER